VRRVFKLPLIFCVAVTSGCGSVVAVNDATRADDASFDGQTAVDARLGCDPLAPFGAKMAIGVSAKLTSSPRLSADELTLYSTFGATDVFDIYSTVRRDRSTAFDGIDPFVSLNTGAIEGNPTVSTDGLKIWFDSDRVAPNQHIYFAERASTEMEFGNVVSFSIANSALTEGQPNIRADGKELFFISDRRSSTGFDIWYTVDKGSGFESPRDAEINSVAVEWFPTISADGLTLYFSSNRLGTQDIFRSQRLTLNSRFASPMLVEELSSLRDDYVGAISADGCRIYGNDGVSFFVASR
jgi:WD40-like Beta Propeller Repeat